MRFQSTRDGGLTAGFSEALLRGLAGDGGLYVPQSWPQVSLERLGGAGSLARLGEELIGPFAAGDRLQGSWDGSVPRRLTFRRRWCSWRGSG